MNRGLVVALLAVFCLSVGIPAHAGLLKKGAKAVAAAALIKKIIVSKKKFPESAQHIEDAQKAGAPKTLTVDRVGAAERRRAALKGKEPEKGMDRDEYPPAMTKEGGENASVRNISSSDNRGSGACIGAQCRDVSDGGKIQIDIVEE